jgi:RNA polymerase sigma-70 factor (ECF subfamily)
MRRSGRRPYQTGNEADEEQMGRAADGKQRAASSIARSKERIDLETDAVTRALKEIVDGFRQKGEWVRVQVLELLFVKGWPNYKVAEFLKVSEQQVANYRFAAVRKLSDAMKAAGLPDDVFPELKEGNP